MLKRYFTFQTPPDPAKYQPRGMYHYMSLPASGYVCVVEEEGSEVPSDWVELPHLLESTPANFNGINTAAGAYVAPALAVGAIAQPAPASIAGVVHTDTTFQVAKKLAKINRHFHP